MPKDGYQVIMNILVRAPAAVPLLTALSKRPLILIRLMQLNVPKIANIRYAQLAYNNDYCYLKHFNAGIGRSYTSGMAIPDVLKMSIPSFLFAGRRLRFVKNMLVIN
jgi:hypothetical protein